MYCTGRGEESEIHYSEYIPTFVYHWLYWPFFYAEFANQSFAVNQLWSFYWCLTKLQQIKTSELWPKSAFNLLNWYSVFLLFFPPPIPRYLVCLHLMGTSIGWNLPLLLLSLWPIMVFCDSFGRSVCFWHKLGHLCAELVYLGLLFRQLRAFLSVVTEVSVLLLRGCDVSAHYPNYAELIAGPGQCGRPALPTC